MLGPLQPFESGDVLKPGAAGGRSMADVALADQCPVKVWPALGGRRGRTARRVEFWFWLRAAGGISTCLPESGSRKRQLRTGVGRCVAGMRKTISAGATWVAPTPARSSKVPQVAPPIVVAHGHLVRGVVVVHKLRRPRPKFPPQQWSRLVRRRLQLSHLVLAIYQNCSCLGHQTRFGAQSLGSQR